MPNFATEKPRELVLVKTFCFNQIIVQLLFGIMSLWRLSYLRYQMTNLNVTFPFPIIPSKFCLHKLVTWLGNLTVFSEDSINQFSWPIPRRFYLVLITLSLKTGPIKRMTCEHYLAGNLNLCTTPSVNQLSCKFLVTSFGNCVCKA